MREILARENVVIKQNIKFDRSDNNDNNRTIFSRAQVGALENLPLWRSVL